MIKKIIGSILLGVLVSNSYASSGNVANNASENWKLKWNNEKGSGRMQSATVKSGKYALEAKSTNSESKALFLRSQKIKVEPGQKYIISGWIKSTTAKASNARIMLQYLDKQGKYTTVSHGIYGGGTHDWKYFERITQIPKDVYFVRLIAGNYMAAGVSWFDDLKLTTADETKKVLAQDGFEAIIDNSANVWNIPIKVAKKKIDALVEINGLKANDDLVHFSSPNELKNLSLTCDYTVKKPGKCYLSSDVGTCYWYSINLKTLKMSLVWSDEKIDLSSKGKKQINIPFQARYQRYFDPLTKGPSVIRGHHYFRVYDLSGKAIGASQSANALAHPESAVFGKRQDQLSASNRNCLYTLANLSKYELLIDKFQANWQANGKFAFKIQVKDADGDIFDLNRVSNLQVTAAGKTLKCSQYFAPYDIPTGWFVASFGKTVPRKINITATVKVNAPAGSKTQQITASFVKTASYPKFTADKKTSSPPMPKQEIRMVFITLHSVLSEDPAKGRQQIKELVKKAKMANINILTPFAMGNRTLDDYATDNKYHKRIFKKYDPLQIMSEECAKAGIELHPAVCLLPEGVETLEGILKVHPEWAMRSVKKRGGWLDPSIPEAREYRIKDIIALAKKYKVDGIMLDYARLALRPSDKGAEIYRQKFGIDPRKYSYGQPEHIKWYKWCSSHLDDMVKEIHNRLKAINPKIKVSAYIQGNKYAGKADWENLHQNHLKWVKEGYVDIICPTGYIFDMLRFRAWSKRQIDTCHQANPNIPCAVTIGVFTSHGALRSSQELNDQISCLRELGGEGASFFRWKYMEKWLEPLREKSYPTPAKIMK